MGENKECRKVIKKIWRVKEGGQGTWKSVVQKLEKSKGGLMKWKKTNGRKNGQEIQQLTEAMVV